LATPAKASLSLQETKDARIQLFDLPRFPVEPQSEFGRNGAPGHIEHLALVVRYDNKPDAPGIFNLSKIDDVGVHRRTLFFFWNLMTRNQMSMEPSLKDAKEAVLEFFDMQEPYRRGISKGASNTFAAPVQGEGERRFRRKLLFKLSLHDFPLPIPAPLLFFHRDDTSKGGD
jgi:hypothetical protein